MQSAREIHNDSSNMKTQQQLIFEAIELLKSLIETPSFSSEEAQTALLLEQWFSENKMKCHRHKNNVWAVNKYFDLSKQTLLLNSHHDTVKPNAAYTRDPFEAKIEGDKLTEYQNTLI